MPSPTQSNQIQAQAGEPKPTIAQELAWLGNRFSGLLLHGLNPLTHDAFRADTETLYIRVCKEVWHNTIPASSSPSSKQEDDPANYPDPRFKWDGKPVEVRGSVVWFKPAGGNGEHGWGQFNPYEAKRLALFINSAIAPKAQQEDDREWEKRCKFEAFGDSEYGYIVSPSGQYDLCYGVDRPAHWYGPKKASDRGGHYKTSEVAAMLAKAPPPPDSKPPTQIEEKESCGTFAVDRWLNDKPTKPTQSVQSEPIKDLVEQARQISKPQSVQSEAEPSAIAKQITNKLWLKVIGMDNIRILAADIDAALKSANERAEAAEKKLECARVNGFLDSMAD